MMKLNKEQKELLKKANKSLTEICFLYYRDKEGCDIMEEDSLEVKYKKLCNKKEYLDNAISLLQSKVRSTESLTESEQQLLHNAINELNKVDSKLFDIEFDMRRTIR